MYGVPEFRPNLDQDYNMDILKKYFSDAPDKPLYHYTTLKGFLGIVNDGELWATNIFYMNDQTELKRALELLNDELNPRIETVKEEKIKLPRKALGPETNPDVFKIEAKLQFLENVKNNASGLTRNNEFQFYVCSFTELDDSLSQWRGYCQDGNGISVGFDFRAFKSDLNLRKCNYDEEDQKQILKELVDGWFNQFVLNIEANIDKTKGNSNFGIGAIVSSHFVVKCISSFFKVAPLFKHPKYKDEAEWRIVIGGGKEKLSKHIKIVDSTYILKPYYCLALARLPQIMQFKVGPSSHISLNKSSAQLFLTSKNMDPELVVESEIPYRGKI